MFCQIKKHPIDSEIVGSLPYDPVCPSVGRWVDWCVIFHKKGGGDLYAYDSQLTVVTYICTDKNKSVILISPFRFHREIKDGDVQKCLPGDWHPAQALHAEVAGRAHEQVVRVSLKRFRYRESYNPFSSAVMIFYQLMWQGIWNRLGTFYFICTLYRLCI